MLAATCKKIGVASPRARRVVRMPSPQPAASRTPSPQPAATSLLETPLVALSCHQLPPTPPPSPPSTVTMPSASPFPSASPPPMDFVSLPYGALQCHQSRYTVYQPSTPRYTPYTVVVPAQGQCAPSVDYMKSYCYSPCYLPRRVSYQPHSVSSQKSSPPVFGVYPAHDKSSLGSSTSLKVRSRRDRRTHRQTIRHSIQELVDERVEEEVIDVVSL